MNTDALMTNAEHLTLNMCLREGPRNAEDQLAMAQVYALLAIANELKRLNDNADLDAELAAELPHLR